MGKGRRLVNLALALVLATLVGFAARAADLGYEAQGVFLWESADYGQDSAGFTAMLQAALAASVPAL